MESTDDWNRERQTFGDGQSPRESHDMLGENPFTLPPPLRYLTSNMTPPSNSGPTAPAAGAPAQGAGFCASCGASLAVGARFCHRCGTPFGQGAPTARAAAASNNLATMLPWGVAFVALLALVANFAGKNFGAAKGSAVDGSANSLPTAAIDGAAGSAPTSAPAAPFAGGAAAGARAPDIANMSPSERAVRLYNRIMEYSEAGKTDSVGFFAPMALASHEMLAAPTIDERYHYGRIAEVTGNADIAKAQADAMLKERPTNLLGLLLAARAARLSNDKAAERTFSQLLLKTADKELATTNGDYDLHRAEIDRAIAEAKALK